MCVERARIWTGTLLAAAAATRPGLCCCNTALAQLPQLRAIFQQLRGRKPGIPQLLQREMRVQLVDAAAAFTQHRRRVPAAQQLAQVGEAAAVPEISCTVTLHRKRDVEQ